MRCDATKKQQQIKEMYELKNTAKKLCEKVDTVCLTKADKSNNIVILNY